MANKTLSLRDVQKLPEPAPPIFRIMITGHSDSYRSPGAENTEIRGLLRRKVARIADVILGGREEANISDRVRRRIEQQQAVSEIIVGWIQAGIIIFFAVLYAISPKAFPPDTQFEPVPWTLGFYALFTAVRIILAHRRRLTPTFVMVSVVVDVAVLMITIWSFHLQYRAPPALYLKAPTLMYVFIFIALRTLRLEPRYVLVAGGCGALGWLALFVFAAGGWDGAAPEVTHSYVDYVTSYKILGGAEIDKVLSILVVTAILALSVIRARKLLINSIAEEVAATDLSRFFAPEVAEQLRRSEVDPASGQGVRRQAAILSVDLRGFTKLSHGMPPSELIELVREYQSRVVPVIQRHHGSIDKYVGDGILASFGAVLPSASYAADLCRTIGELVDAARAWRIEREGRGLVAPELAMAGATGEVVFGMVGHETRLEYTAIGEVVNLASKLEKLTRREGVSALTTSEAYALALAQGYSPPGAVEQRPGRSVEGISEPLDLVALAT